jgi:hypothetical protein
VSDPITPGQRTAALVEVAGFCQRAANQIDDVRLKAIAEFALNQVKEANILGDLVTVVSQPQKANPRELAEAEKQRQINDFYARLSDRSNSRKKLESLVVQLAEKLLQQEQKPVA